MASRRIEDLELGVAELARKHQLACLERGVELLIYCTLRDEREQAELYAQGRTAEQLRTRRNRLARQGLQVPAALLASIKPRPTARKLTNAGPGESFHQYGLAYDCVPLVQGKPVWSPTGAGEPLWKKVAAAGESIGLEWAGRWTTFREMPHFQATGGRSIEDLLQERFAGGAGAGAMAGAGTGGGTAARAGAAAGAPAGAPPLAAADESDRLAAALREPNTVLLVLASLPGVPEAQLQAVLDVAKRVVNINPAVWRTFHVRDLGALRADLVATVWGQAPPTPAVTLGLAAGAPRRRKGYSLAQLDTTARVFDAYSTA
jgi:peptidoglycan L-alanyl-D-glutamate endopeptidase CwlK